MTNISITETTLPGVAERRPWTISWGAVFAGVFTALVSQLLLNMLGIGIGAATIGPFYGSSPDAAAFSWAAYAWWAASGIISAFFGGWVSGALVGQWWRFDGAVHGFISWCIATLVVVFVFAGVIGGMGGLAANVAGPLAAQYAANNPREVHRIGDLTTQEFSQLMRANRVDSGTLAYEAPSNRATTPAMGPTSPNATAMDASQTDQTTARTATESPATAEPSDLAQNTTDTTTTGTMPAAPANTATPPSNYEGQYAYEPTPQAANTPTRIAQSRANAERMADAVAQGAIWSFVALLLGALAAVGGGYMASSAREDEIRAMTR